jgi:hypothetical protein
MTKKPKTTVELPPEVYAQLKAMAPTVNKTVDELAYALILKGLRT